MERTPEPRWEVPSSYGYAAAIESMGSIAAPLLGGVSIALVILVLQSEQAFGWANLALLLLILAAFSFGAALQVTFRARRFAVTPPEMEMWWPDAAEPERRKMLREEQRRDLAEHHLWAVRASDAYNAGLLVFLLGIAACLVPAGGLKELSLGRGAVLLVVIVGFVSELAWMSRTRPRGA